MRDSVKHEDDEEGAVKETDKEENHLEDRADGERKRTCFGHCRDAWNGMRRRLWGIVESKYFSRGIMIAILINTISMGIEHHNQVRLSLYAVIISHCKCVPSTEKKLPISTPDSIYFCRCGLQIRQCHPCVSH